MVGAGVSATGYGAHLIYKHSQTGGKEGSIEQGTAFIALGMGLGAMMHLPARMLADPLIRKAVTEAMDAAGGPKARTAAMAAASVIQHADPSIKIENENEGGDLPSGAVIQPQRSLQQP
jgi:hypothetical protein